MPEHYVDLAWRPATDTLVSFMVPTVGILVSDLLREDGPEEGENDAGGWATHPRWDADEEKWFRTPSTERQHHAWLKEAMLKAAARNGT
ncbi:hypothetical protein LCGC14_2060680 [marine sediment metagenome]|uniref:Uncharacterized protein n=1 Tax=marine sediment metagenome TaxID=412755 RepID=A0A0F9EL81_9ZZZZ